jgi:hypothetical protein
MVSTMVAPVVSVIIAMGGHHAHRSGIVPGACAMAMPSSAGWKTSLTKRQGGEQGQNPIHG